MKRYITSDDYVFGMSNLNPRRTDLPVIIWADHNGVDRAVSHRESPRVKISKDAVSISVSIEANPRILAQSEHISKADMNDLQQGIAYVARNYDLFLKHYLDTDFSFDDDDLKDALRERGDYR